VIAMTASTMTSARHPMSASNKETNMDRTDTMEPGATWV
jgi:hypothetical protein